MNNKEVEQIFIDTLESTPGISAIIKSDDEFNSNIPAVFNVCENNNIWNFIATMKLHNNSNAKDIVNSVSNTLKFKLKRKKQNIGKINLFIGGISND
ncbi:hypothetical protein [Mycoplasmopsis felifaucium]|uniref:hypothetical protein n=1 Tax=Mycoplasmopsis felifaucium TaxID=35768 RepID=UPI0004805284|nr:hypothetical protein [Mycoplasmopsis felifaucium]